MSTSATRAGIRARIGCGLLAALLSGCAGAFHPQPALMTPPSQSLCRLGDPVTLTDPEERRVLAVLGTFPSGVSERGLRCAAKVLLAESYRNRLDPYLVLGLIRVESSGWTRARSDKNARGWMQILPFVARELASETGDPWEGADGLYDPVLNLRLGTRYLGQLYQEFGSMETALAAYNMGPSRMERLKERGVEPDGYGTMIFWFARRYREIAESEGDLAPGLDRIAVDIEMAEREIGGRPKVALAKVRGRRPRILELNRASARELLQVVPGMTASAAEAIVRDRSTRGRFGSVEDLDRIPLLDRELAERLKAMSWVEMDGTFAEAG